MTICYHTSTKQKKYSLNLMQHLYLLCAEKHVSPFWIFHVFGDKIISYFISHYKQLESDRENWKWVWLAPTHAFLMYVI